MRFIKTAEMIGRPTIGAGRGLVAAVDEHYAALPENSINGRGSASPDDKRQKTLEFLASIAQEDPNLFREALEKLGMANPLVFQQAVPDMYDSQTGLMSKGYFECIVLPERVETARTEGKPLSYLMIDIDGFKEFNDKYGHSIGDKVIAFVAEVIKGSVRGYNTKTERQPDFVGIMRNEVRLEEPTYTFARVGEGEEFAIILYDTTLGQAYEIGERLRTAIERHRLDTERYGPLSITVSVGAAELMPAMTAEQLRKSADEMLYAAKDEGRNRVYAHGYLSPAPKR